MTDLDTKQISMFGCTTDALDMAIAAQDFAPWLLPISILSDAQELLAAGEIEAARLHMNRAKYVIDKLFGRDLIDILTATRMALNTVPNHRFSATKSRFASTYDIASALSRHPIAHSLSLPSAV